MKKKYDSPNGYTGIQTKGNFLGFSHWDFTIYETQSGKMVYHATLSKPHSEKMLKEQVDGFPEFLEKLCALRRKDN